MKYRILYFLGLMLIFSACSSGIKVTADRDANTDFSKFTTYSYLGWTENSSKLLHEANKRGIEMAFSNEFKKRGMTYVESNGDVEVSLFLVTEQKTATQAYTNYYRPYGGYYYGHAWGWNNGYAQTTYHQYDYTEGTLVCDVFDGVSKKLIWQSVGSGTVEDGSNIPQAVQKIMSLYPIPPKK